MNGTNEWTINAPTRPGEYWVTLPNTDREDVITVFGPIGWKEGDDLFTRWGCGASVTDPEIFPTGTKWFGPIGFPSQGKPISVVAKIDSNCDCQPMDSCSHWNERPIQLWIAMDGDGSVALFEREPEWVEAIQSWMCDMTGILEFSFPYTSIRGLTPGQKRLATLNYV